MFIWSSVEPSIGIISGCLPTLRPLLIHVVDTCSTHLPSTRKSLSTDTDSPPYPLDPLETISKKRTRKISKNDDLEHTVVEEDDNANNDRRNDRKPWSRTKKADEHSSNWRPDEDEMCLTTTTVHGSDKQVGFEEFLSENQEAQGITMTTEFDWDEAKRDK